MSLKGEWEIKFNKALLEMEDLTNNWARFLTDEEIKGTLMYKLDEEWVEYLIKENYTIIDFGDLYLKSEINMPKSPFYEMELKKIF